MAGPLGIGISIATIIFYSLSALWLLRLLLTHKTGDKLIRACSALAIVMHLWVLNMSIFVEPGQNLSITNVASLVAWVITLCMWVATLFWATRLLLPVVYGFAVLIVLMTLVIPDTHIMHIELRPALVVHIGLALLAYGSLMIAALYALQLGYINGKLKQKQASLLNSPLPPLMDIERILFKLLSLGTSLLTLSIASGFVFLQNMLAQGQAHKTVLSLLAWVVFVIVTVGHARLGWRGKPIIAATIAGTILLTLAYFGSRVVREVILGRF